MATSTEFTVERNGQTVKFLHHAGTVGEDLPDIEQTTEFYFHNAALGVQPRKDYLLSGVHVQASNVGLALQAKRVWAEWGAGILAQREMTEWTCPKGDYRTSGTTGFVELTKEAHVRKHAEDQAKSALDAYNDAWRELQAAKRAWAEYTGPRVNHRRPGNDHPSVIEVHPDAAPFVSRLFRANAHVNTTRATWQRAAAFSATPTGDGEPEERGAYERAAERADLDQRADNDAMRR